MYMKVTIERKEEILLSPTERMAIAQLLAEAFPDYPKNATHFNHAPQFRLLAYAPDGALVGQMGVTHRWVSLDERPYSVLGIIDLCVSPPFHNRQIGRQLLAAIEAFAHASGQIDALLLTAESPAFYEAQGFRLTHHKVKWLMLKNGHSWGVVHRALPHCLLAKPINLADWPSGDTLDCCGPMF